MGLRGPVGTGDIQIIEARSDRPVPRPPADLHPVILEEWRTYWTSDVAQAADDVDIPMVTRLFTYRDEWYRMSLEYAMLPLDERLQQTNSRSGNTLRLHPFADRMTKLESEISKLEDKLGLSPLSRARLGIEIGQQKLTWHQLAKTAAGESGSKDELQGAYASLPVAGVRNE